ncbi:MAG: protease pro-enzyme activation domain-containing protein [Terracidiphilus sp.]
MIKKLLQSPGRLWVCGWIVVYALSTTSQAAQTPSPRIRAEVNNSQMTLLKGSQHPLALAQNDAGRMSSDVRLKGMSIVFNRSAAQQADLDALIVAQQDPASPLYHLWLNPDQFAARFGMAQSDIDKVQSWLQQQGFSIDSVARSRNLIRFSGTVGQVEQAFQTQMHFYTVRGEKHFAPSTTLSLPSAIAASVATIANLDDFRPRAMHIRSNAVQPRPGFTSGQTGNVFFAPGDIKLIYDLNPLLNAAITGAGQSIAIMGQSSVATSDLENFQNAAGLPVKDPTMVIVPGSGGPTVFQGDESESDLDLEWSGAIAPGADIFFVYTGSSTNFGVFDSLQYAIDEKIGTIISVSYGACEPNISAANATALEAVVSQGVVQGQTILAASGDTGSTACYTSPTTTNPPLTTQEAVAVSYPASSQYVTGVGGTEISQANSAYYTSGSAYWTAESGGNDVLTSALQYIPEVVWNDSALSVQGGGGLSAGGGGVSTLYTKKPSWQTGVPGIPSDNSRDVPDVSLFSSPAYLPYIYCSSDPSAFSTGQVASCSSGFRDNATGDLTLAGGTSFATPIFAGMVAILNQQKGYTTGQGLLNPQLYKLASNSTTYAAAFHDITSGNNACPASLGSSYCAGTGTTHYTAGTGYDQASGLGSVDLSNLATAWPANTGTPLIATTTTVTAATAAPNVSTNDIITISVAQAGGTATPTGTVNLSIDGSGSAYGSGSLTPVTLTGNGTVTYTANFATAGVHTIVAQYAGDGTNAPSTGSAVITVGGTSSGKGTFAMGLAPATLTLSQGSQGTESLTITPAGGYTGTVNLTYATSNDTALTNLCIFAGTGTNSNGSITITGTTAAAGQIIVDTNASDCVSTTGGAVKAHGLHLIPRSNGSLKASNQVPKENNPVPAGIAFAGLLLAGFLGRSNRKLRQLACVIALASLGLMISACGGGGTSGSTVSDPPKGTYTITFAGTDSTTSTITAQSAFSLVIK